MTHRTRHRNEDPAATHARLHAAALASHANACAAADAFLTERTIPDPENMPPDLVLTDTASGRIATIGAGARDERQFTSPDALRVYVRTCIVMSLTVRRDGWTMPDPANPRIRPDSARLLLRAGNPLVDIVAGIAMDGSLEAPSLRYEDGENRMRRFDHEAHQLDERGIRYVARLFKT